MTRPNPSHTRAVAFGAAALIIAAAFCAAGALAQSGRKAQKPLGLPTEAAKPSDPADKTPATKKEATLYTFVVVKDDTLSMGFDSLMRDGVAGAFFERLRQAAGHGIEVNDGGRGRRPEARERAKKEQTAYVVFFQMDETGEVSSTSSRSILLRTYVYTPKTGDLKYSDTIFQRPYQDTARIGGVRVPVPTRRAERYPSQNQLEQAARDAADRLLSRFSITPPPEQ
jgi:hypothetical protein